MSSNKNYESMRSEKTIDVLQLKAIDTIVASEKAKGKPFKPGKDFTEYLKKIKKSI